MPTLPGESGAPRPRSAARTSGARCALSASRTRGVRPARASASRSARACSATRVTSNAYRGVPCVARERLRVASGDEQAPVLDAHALMLPRLTVAPYAPCPGAYRSPRPRAERVGWRHAGPGRRLSRGVRVKFLKRHASETADAAPATGAPAPDVSRPFAGGFIPDWFKRVGLASWYLIGIAIVLIGLAYALQLLATLVVPTLFAVLLGATFLPLVDWLERHHIGRTWGALIVTVLIVVGAFALLALMTVGVVQQWPTIEHQIQAAVDWINETLQKLDIDPSLIDSAKKTLTGSVGSWAQGIFGGAVQGISTLATFAFAPSSASTSSSTCSSAGGASAAGSPSTWGRCRRRWATRSWPTARGSCAATSGAARSSACSTAPWSASARSSSACRWRSRSSWSSGSPTTSRCSGRSSAGRSRCSSRWERAA